MLDNASDVDGYRGTPKLVLQSHSKISDGSCVVGSLFEPGADEPKPILFEGTGSGPEDSKCHSDCYNGSFDYALQGCARILLLIDVDS